MTNLGYRLKKTCLGPPGCNARGGWIVVMTGMKVAISGFISGHTGQFDPDFKVERASVPHFVILTPDVGEGGFLLPDPVVWTNKAARIGR